MSSKEEEENKRKRNQISYFYMVQTGPEKVHDTTPRTSLPLVKFHLNKGLTISPNANTNWEPHDQTHESVGRFFYMDSVGLG